jgi:hypothetical protein
MAFSVTLLLFQYKPVQTWAAKKAADYLSSKLHAKVGIRSVAIKPFSSVTVEGLYVLDEKKDTLLNAPKLTINLKNFSILRSISQKTIDFKLIQLDDGDFYLKRQKNNRSNLRFILDYFSSSTPDTSKTASKPWKIIFETVAINNLHFRYKNQRVPDTLSYQVNFDDIDVKGFSAVIKNIDFKNHLFKGDITNLTLHEKSGFYLKKFNTRATIDSNQILAQNLFVLTNHSSLKNFFRMKFKTFEDINDHIADKVYMEGDFHSSQISSADVSYFTDGLSSVKFDLGLDGRIQGFVNKLTGKDLRITGGKSTYIKGNFSLTGLPKWNSTFLDLKFDRLATNKPDMDFLYNRFTGTTNRHVPNVFEKFGDIDFVGQFKGYQRDFKASGSFKTKLGRFDPDIALKIDRSGTPVYSGKIDTYAFNVGSLLDNETLGMISLNATFDGAGNDLKHMTEKLNATISSIDFKGYSYKNVAIDGTFQKEVGAADITIDDENVKLNLTGTVDLNPALPVYDFKADISKAQFQPLNLLKDTITFTSQLTSKFSGNALSNLTGSLSLSQTRIIDPRNNYVLDSLKINATDSGGVKSINLRSDFADGYIKGNYDLATLPGYFKTIVKQYVPSLKNADSVIIKPQDFEFKLEIKNPDPLIAFFKPNLHIPEQGTINGKFDSENKTETIGGYIKTIRLGKTVFHNLILDGSNYKDYLGLNISLDKIELTDSLFIKNVTINNFLKNDSLNFNVKLSDQNTINSLDLYGLVNFGKDTVATIQLLPSDITLEQQDWRVADKVRIRLLTGKTEVSGFEMSSGIQKVKIDGFISDNPLDELKVTFDKFSMATFNQLTRRQEGVQLSGLLNGDVKLSELLNSPGIDAHLGIDSLAINKTLVGNVKVESDLGPDRKKAGLKVSVTNHGVETLKLTGTYGIGHNEDDNLDFDVKMNQTQGVIFEPFINDLVSNVKGNISTNLRVTGPPSWPQLNGTIILSGTGVTVNYLKTAYKVTDTLRVTNSVININNMSVTDSKGGTGTITGTVDLNNFSNPDIEAELTAKNLMALNTTFRDNHLYYGSAFATGRFTFSGPVKNLDIDIKAKTETGTVFNIPLNTSTTVSDNDFIHFVSHRDTNKIISRLNSFNGITLDMDLTTNEKSLVRITTDYGLLEGRGQANDLSLKINSLGDFEMFGDFLISSGKFDFTAKNFISKNFLVNEGGTIRWTGNPANANINLSAIYEVRTDIQPLYAAAGSSSPKGHSQELVQAQVILTKSLLQPNIDFNFNFPLDPSINEDLTTYLSDNNNRSQQALSIIVRRQFSSGANGNINQQVQNTAGEVISEFAFNKVNSFISQSNIKGFDLNIRSLNDLSASYRIKDRLIFTGSLFNPYSNTSSGGVVTTSSSDLIQSNSSFFNTPLSSLTKDFDIQYLIRKDGALSARYSYRLLNSTTLNTLYNQLNEDYVNGLGLIYQRDFDNFGEFLHLIFNGNTTKFKQIQLPKPQNTTALSPTQPGQN